MLHHRQHSPRTIGTLLHVALVLTCASSHAAQPRKAANRPWVTARNAELVNAIQRQPDEPAWRYIVIHHTAAETDSLKGISAFHARKFRDPLGIEYHFLIGNGHAAGDGEIQIARWRHRAQSIHVAHPERAPSAITVSIQGNLHERAPSPAQMLAVERLVRKLMALYEIPADRISTNTNVDGTVTVCPGRYFPVDRLLWRLRHTSAVSAADWTVPLAPVPMEGPWPSLDAMHDALWWDRPCREPIAVGPWQVLQTATGRDPEQVGKLLGIDGGRGCANIQRRFLALHDSTGWYRVELNGYRESRIRRAQVGGAFAVEVADERGKMLVCRAEQGDGPLCQLTKPSR